jgi:hypothetical protein
MLSNMAATAVSGPGPRQCACPRCAQIPTPTRAARRAGVSQGPRVRRYALARQIVGFDMRVIRGEEDTAVYGQPFMLLGDALESETVGAELGRWAKEKLIRTEVQ